MTLETIGTTLIFAAGVIWAVELIPQIVKLNKTKNSSGISFLFFWMTLAAYITYVIGNIVLANWAIVIAHIPSTLLTMWILKLLYKYKTKRIIEQARLTIRQ